MSRELGSERMADFLRKRAETPFSARYLMAGVLCELSTNWRSILEAADESFLEIDTRQDTPALRARFWVDSQARDSRPWANPYCRGLDHLVFVGFDNHNALLVNLSERRAIGRFSPALAEDRAHWKSIVFPVLLSIIAASFDVVEVHSACVTRREGGLLLAGDSGSGKSTLAFALTQRGFGFLSDDRTYLSRQDRRLHAWGLPTHLKLRPDATELFPQLKSCQLGSTLDGERAFHIDPDRHFGLRRSLHCEPRWLVFLQRKSRSEINFEEIPKADATARLKKDLMLEAPEATESQLRMLDAVTEGKCWLLRYGGEPLDVAAALAHFCLSTLEAGSSHNDVHVSS